MNADAFRHFYNYHFAENRKIWEAYILPLSQEQFTQTVNYSHGSVQSQILHLINVDNLWFCELRNEIPDPLEPDQFTDRTAIRARWDEIEQMMRGYLAALSDDQLSEKPITIEAEDKNLIQWQVLLHVVNHGTDHRAQLLRLLNDLGVKTKSQDYIFYVYDNP